MLVDKNDAVCQACGGQLEAVEADDIGIEVECLNPDCGEAYKVEPDGLNDGCTKYWPVLMAEQEEEERGDFE